MNPASVADLAGQPDALRPAIGWIAALLTGGLATSLAVLGIAWVGFDLLLGKTPVRRGIRVVVGCFILFGAPLISQGMMSLVHGRSAVPFAAPDSSTEPSFSGIDKAPPYDPYAGASIPDR